MFYKSAILRWIKTMFKYSEQRQWYETYWFFDFHGVISKPDYRKKEKEVIYYPYAKETLQYITANRPDIVMILFTSSYPEEIKVYVDKMKQDNIIFKYINENPEISDAKGCFGCYDKKPYYNVLFDDKCSFSPEKDWKSIYKYFKKTKYRPDPKWSFKNIEKYHGKQITD
jgi:hypothetical protein